MACLLAIGQDAFGLLDARIGVEEEHRDAYLWGRNLTVQKYSIFAFDAGLPDGVLVIAGEPRSFVVEFRVSF